MAESMQILQDQEQECQTFTDEVIVQAQQLNDAIEKLKQKIQNKHDTDCKKSFLKANLNSYLKTLNSIQVVELKKLFANDL